MIVRTINKFTGGITGDVRERSSVSYTTCAGFDSATYPNRLVPYSDSEADVLVAGDITDKRISDIVRDGNGQLLAVGRESTATPTTIELFGKSSATNIASTWSSVTTLAGAGGYKTNSLVYYTGSGAYLLDASFNVRKWDGAWTNVGAVDVVSTWGSIPVPRPFVHPLDNNLYFAGGQALAMIDVTTYSDITSVVLPRSLLATSLTDYGSDLAIASTPVYMGESRVFLWDRNTSSTVFRDSIPWGEESLLILENIDGILVGVSINEKTYVPTASYTTVKDKKLVIRAYQGGAPIVIKEIPVSSDFILRNYKQKIGGRLYFGGDYYDALFVIYKGKRGEIIVSRDRNLNNGNTITTFRGFSLIGDYLFSMFDTTNTTGNIYRTKVTSTYTGESTFESLINQDMPLEDLTKKKKLHFISVAKTSTAGQLVVYVSVDGSAYEIAGTLTSGGKLVLKEARLASGSPFSDGYEFQFRIKSTGGAEITELKYGYDNIEKNI